MPVVLAVAWAFGWLLGRVLRLARWLLRALWAIAWHTVVLLLALGVVAFCRPLAWRLAVLGLGVTLSGRLRGGRWGKGPNSEHRTSPLQPVAPVRLKPVSAQAVATASYAETRWFTAALDGPELLTMLVGPAGAGKSELVWATLRAQHDGEAFCGLETTRPRRVLLLSEMGGATLQPALRRWGFYAEPAGRFPRLDAIRLRLVPPRGHAGALVDVLYAADIYRPVVVEGELRQTEWPAVVEAVRELVARGRYDRVIVDSLGEWMGADNNDAMLRTLGACRQLTHAGAGVTILHHTPRSDPKRPRGGTVIEAKLDVGSSVTGLGPGGAPRSRRDPVRSLEWFKTRFPEQTPAQALLLERVWAGPESGERPGYRVAVQKLTAEPEAHPGAAPEPVQELTAPALTPQVRQVLEALRAAGRGGASTTQLAEATGLNRGRAHEALIALIKAGEARVGGYGTKPAGGGKAPGLYVATRAPEAAHPHLRLVAPEESA